MRKNEPEIMEMVGISTTEEALETQCLRLSTGLHRSIEEVSESEEPISRGLIEEARNSTL